MKKFLILIMFLSFVSVAQAFDYVPKDVNSNPFGDKTKTNLKLEQTEQEKVQDINNLTDYFKYLPNEVHKNWVPYKTEVGYEVTVQFRVHRDGSIDDINIVKTTNEKANTSVINAVKAGAPYLPLPKSYPNKDGVVAQVILEYRK